MVTMLGIDVDNEEEDAKRRIDENKHCPLGAYFLKQ